MSTPANVEIQRFDFSSLNQRLPSGVRVRHTDGYFHMERQTADANRHFVILRKSGEFWLYQFNSAWNNSTDALSNCTGDNFVIRTDELARLMKLLGLSR